MKTQMSVQELLHELHGRLSYRQLDYWIRTGAVPLRHPGHGSGSRRTIMPDERIAIHRLVDEYERIEHETASLRSGELFLELLDWHDVEAVS